MIKERPLQKYDHKEVTIKMDTDYCQTTVEPYIYQIRNDTTIEDRLVKKWQENSNPTIYLVDFSDNRSEDLLNGIESLIAILPKALKGGGGTTPFSDFHKELTQYIRVKTALDPTQLYDIRIYKLRMFTPRQKMTENIILSNKKLMTCLKKYSKMYYTTSLFPINDKKEKKKQLVCFAIDRVLFWLTHEYIYKLTDFHSTERVQRVYVSIHEYFTGLKPDEAKKINPLDENITIGADPEFLIYKKSKKYQDKANYDELIYAEDLMRNNPYGQEVGCDVCTDLGELRPMYGNSPLTFTSNVKASIKKLAKALNKNNRLKNLFIEVGGGCRRTIGGHLHLGHSFLRNDQIKKTELLRMLDDFIYLPIKNNMLGGMRFWSCLKDKIDLPKYNQPDKIHQAIKKISPKDKSSLAYGSYEYTSAYRYKNYGIEYRSLPSFIADERLTFLVSKLTYELTREFLQLCYNLHRTFSYCVPVKEEDYRKLLTAKETYDFLEYLYGSNQDIFLKNLFDNWKIDFSSLLEINLVGFFECNDTWQTATEICEKLENSPIVKSYLKKWDISNFTLEFFYDPAQKEKTNRITPYGAEYSINKDWRDLILECQKRQKQQANIILVFNEAGEKFYSKANKIELFNFLLESFIVYDDFKQKPKTYEYYTPKKTKDDPFADLPPLSMPIETTSERLPSREQEIRVIHSESDDFNG